ncbi:MAG: hypothetical protein PHE20_00665 [Patescibacteria group bacterium]|nr:hypothetical protein [Patescibacteria group bacterium]
MRNGVVIRGLFLMLLVAGLFVFGVNSGSAAYITAGNSQWLQNASSIYYDSGNVGIGTTNPTSKLHVNGTSYFGGTRFATAPEVINTTDSGITVLKNLATLNDAVSSDLGAIVVDTTIPFVSNLYNQHTMKFSGYNGSAFEFRIGGYSYGAPGSEIYTEGRYYNTSVEQFAGSYRAYKNNTTGNLSFAFGSVDASYGKIKFSVDEWISGHNTLAGNYSEGWTVSTKSDLSGYTLLATLTNGNYFNTINTAYFGGSVGIGTTNPTTKLFVNGGTGDAVNVGGGRIRGLNTTPVNADEAVPLTYLQSNYAPIGSGAGSAFVQGGNSFGSIANLGTNDNYPLNIKTNNATQMTVLGNGNVGIGTTNPLSLLHLYGATGATTEYIKFTSADGGDIRFGKQTGVNNDAIIGTWTNNNLSFYTNTGERVRITNTGNVGIGTTNPQTKLDVTGPVNIIGQTINGISHYQFEGATYRNPGDFTPSLLIRQDNPNPNPSGFKPALSLYNNDGSLNTTVGLSFVSRGLNTGTVAVELGGIMAINEVNGSAGGWAGGGLLLYTQNLGTRVDALRILTGGNVGIGTTNPTTKLYVNAGTGDAVNVGGGRIRGLNTTPVNADEAVPLTYLQSNYGTSASELWKGTINGNIWNGDSGAGNVGIGTTNPGAYRLNVSGNGLFSDTLTVNKGVKYATPAAVYFENIALQNNSSIPSGFIKFVTPIRTSHNQMFSVDITGYDYNTGKSIDFTVVGYAYSGTDSIINLGFSNRSSFKREVRAALEDRGDGYRVLVIALGASDVDGNCSEAWYFQKFGATVRLWAGASTSYTADQFSWVNGEASLAAGHLKSSNLNNQQLDGALGTIITTGSVGIGTTNPTTKLYVNAGTGDAVNVGGGRIRGLNTTPVNADEAVPLTYLQSNYGTSASELWKGTKNGNIWNGDSGAGNVGIGTTNPVGKLTVAGSANQVDVLVDGNLRISGASNQYLRFNDNTHSYIDIVGDSGILKFNNQNVGTAMSILYNGNVGVGTDAPVAKLTVYQGMSDYSTSFTAPHIRLQASTAVDNTGFVGITYAGSTSDTYGWSSGALRSNSGQSSFIWKHHSASAAGTEWMRITNTGDIGIGTTNPTTKLFVNGGTGDAVNVGGGRIRGLNTTPINADEAVPLTYLQSNYTPTSMSASVYATSTPSSYNGNQGGYTSANAFCSATLAGTHVCTSEEILQTINGGSISLPANTTLWINSGPPGYTVNANDCIGWTSASATSYGTVWVRLASGDGFGALNKCDGSRRYACCK